MTDDDQAQAFAPRETQPIVDRPAGRWLCTRCGSPRVRPDPVALFDRRYTTGRCAACHERRTLIRHE